MDICKFMLLYIHVLHACIPMSVSTAVGSTRWEEVTCCGCHASSGHCSFVFL